MSSQNTLSQQSTLGIAPTSDVNVPETPKPQHASLPESAAALTSTGELPSLQASRIESSKYSSPPALSTSMTPPSSSQPAPLARFSLQQDRRKTTPPTSHLSSPPASGKPSLSLCTVGASGSLPTIDDISNASAAEVRALITKLYLDLKEARTSAAHHKLQHSLLSLETTESAKRMEVEHEMTRREVEFLMEEKTRRRVASSPFLHRHDANSSPHAQLPGLKVHCEALQAENQLLQRRLRTAKKMITQRDGEVASLHEDNQRLRKRIKENREHLNQLRSPGGIYQTSTPRAENPTPRTPRHQSSVRASNVGSARAGSRGDPFAALILADQVLSQESASVPSTPTRSRPAKQHSGHHRGAHSLSSLPSTPYSSRPATANSVLLPPANIPPINTRFATLGKSTQEVPKVQRSRRESRDSTVSASDVTDAVQRSSGSEDLPDSQASQLASRMLKVAPEEKVEVISTPPPQGTSSTLLQSKLFGKVQKGGIERPEKRKWSAGKVESVKVGKKAKTGSVGLGIGGLSGPRG